MKSAEEVIAVIEGTELKPSVVEYELEVEPLGPNEAILSSVLAAVFFEVVLVIATCVGFVEDSYVEKLSIVPTEFYIIINKKKLKSSVP